MDATAAPSHRSRTGSAPRTEEIHDVDALRARLREGAPLAGLRLEALDLTGPDDADIAGALRARDDLHGLVVLGGRLDPALAQHLSSAGAVVFPTDPDVPVDVYRSHLYSPDELYAGLEHGYATTPDARAYAWTLDAATADDHYAAVLRALHDDCVLDALGDLLTGDDRPVVGIMGGHAVTRGGGDYADAARLGRELARAGRVVVTGGGPGAMEAANLGALAADASEDALDAALADLARVPSFRPSIADWARVALDVRSRLRVDGAPVRSFGIPTWFYGHEPPNVFGEQIAKLFSNALREDELLRRCTGGVVVLPGAAGTVQEIFQATTRLYYGAAPLPPLVLVGRDAWTRDVPAWPLLQALAAGRPMADVIHLVDDVEQAAAVVG